MDAVPVCVPVPETRMLSGIRVVLFLSMLGMISMRSCLHLETRLAQIPRCLPAF